jgi:hypothetical protein
VIDSYRYEPADGVLLITFVSGQVYAYFDVPPEVGDGLRTTSSRGRYFASRIRDRFQYRRLTPA